MKAYKINKGQKNAIENTMMKSGVYFHPIEDINGDWFIFEIEMDSIVKNKGWKNSLEAEYIPPIKLVIPE